MNSRTFKDVSNQFRFQFQKGLGVSLETCQIEILTMSKKSLKSTSVLLRSFSLVSNIFKVNFATKERKEKDLRFQNMSIMPCYQLLSEEKSTQ